MTDTKQPEKEEATFNLKEELHIPQRDGTSVVLPIGPVPMADAKRYAQKKLLDLNTGKAPKEETKK